ncbi:super-infection exclusion protein B [uncultured Maribacter sp.]|uniref:super-infection exclusion protein B n=1 Tax=uncultured Maribacter sp. TaxID=431308 RepID=UPI002626FFE6|nr:super-infection exclusion protein B [uncultured Maribacter sp.]
MEKYLKAIFDLTKLPTKFFFLLSAVSGFVLFVDQKFLNEKLFLDNVKENYGWILGIIFILSTGLVLVNFVIWIFKSIRRKILINKWKKKFAERIKTLDRFEKSILREFILNGQKSVEMPIDNPSVSGLLDNNILVMNRQFGNSSIMNGLKTSLSINESVMEILELKDIDLSEPPTEKEIEFAKNNRPEWTNRYY